MANRLEKAIEIINLRNRYYEELDETEAINYIIEQAERVQELEKELQFCKVTNYILKVGAESNE